MIHILYRHTEHATGFGKSRPTGFSYEKCLNNILGTIEDTSEVLFHLLYDGTCKIQDTRIHYTVEFNGGSDEASFNFAWKYAKELVLEEKDLVYFLENDYLHVPNWYNKVQDLYDSFNVSGYVSLYDHLDKYTNSVYDDLQSYIYVTKSSHWRTTPSTCGSFVVNRQTLQEDFDVHTTFYSDHDKFLYLSNTRNRIIVSSIPGLSTHCESDYMSPIINWNEIC